MSVDHIAHTLGITRQTVSGDLKLLSNEQVENVGSPLSVFFQHMPLLSMSSPFSPLRFLHGFLPSKSRYVDHGPEEMQAYDTSHEKAQVQAL